MLQPVTYYFWTVTNSDLCTHMLMLSIREHYLQLISCYVLMHEHILDTLIWPHNYYNSYLAINKQQITWVSWRKTVFVQICYKAISRFESTAIIKIELTTAKKIKCCFASEDLFIHQISNKADVLEPSD